MPEKLQKEIEQTQKGLGESGRQKEEKSESKAARIIRNVLLWVFALGFIAFFIMLLMRKCS